MTSECILIVALEDLATAGVVAVGAAHAAMEQEASRLILLHVLDEHVIANSFSAWMNAPPPVVECAEEGSAILRQAKAAIEAECRAANMPVPTITCRLGEGRAGPTICQVATDAGAAGIILGARRPHALGRLTHPDVVEHLRSHTTIPVHVVALQAEIPQPMTSPAAGPTSR